MSFIDNIKTMFGMESEPEAPTNAIQSHTPSYINPFKKEELAEPVAEPTTSTKDNVDVEAAISDEIVEKVTSVLNSSLPEYARECIDKDAQAKYVKSLIGSALSDFLSNVHTTAKESARQEWQKERMDLAHKSAETDKQLNEYRAKSDELRNRMQSLDRQKTTLNERIISLEARVATAEAEREQYELECKSLMNKLKVAAVSDESLQSAQSDNNELREANTQLQQELDKTKSDAEAIAKEAEEALRVVKEELEAKDARIAELSANTDATASNEEVEKLSAELNTAKVQISELNGSLAAQREVIKKAKTEIEEVKKSLDKANADNQQLKAQMGNNATDKDELQRLTNELSLRDNELAGMRSTIQSQNDEIYALNEKLNEVGDTANLSQLMTDNNALKDQVEKITLELSQKSQTIDDLNETKQEITEVYERLKKELERNKKHYSEKEEEFRKQIVALTDDLDSANNEISLLKAEKRVPKKKEADKPASHPKGVSAIDYSTEFSDWLMPTPPSDAIPISAEPEVEFVDDPVEEEQPKKSKTKHNPNIPEQMELF